MYWMNKKSVSNVEEMNTDTFKIFELIRQPLLVAFVDLKSKKKQEFR